VEYTSLESGLGDVSHGETVYFSPLAEVTVDIPETLPLSIFTAGEEVDRCRPPYPDFPGVRPDKMEAILKQPEETWERSVQDYAIRYSTPRHLGPENGYSSLCSFFHNDPLGNIIKFYKPPGYGAGVHEEFAGNADYILRYTITVIPPIAHVNKEITPGTTNFTSQLNSDFSLKSTAP
jgi:hypothetical protein